MDLLYRLGKSFCRSGKGEQGAAYLFKRSGTTWSFIRRLDDETGMASEYFGGAVAINGFNLAVGGAGKNANKGEVQFLNIE